MKLVTVESIRAAYRLLKLTAFANVAMPARVKFLDKNIPDLGWYETKSKRITIDSKINKMDLLITTVAHEMCHAALEQNGNCDHVEHDENFKALARIVEHEMGWPKGSV